MTTLRVHCFLQHNTDTSISRNQDEWDTYHMRRAIKGEPMGSYVWFKGIKYEKVDASALLEALAVEAAQKILSDGAATQVVPLPNSDAVEGSTHEYGTLKLARLIVGKSGRKLSVCDCLRWRRETGKAHTGQKIRDHLQHYQDLRVIRRPVGPVVLFDDIITTGSQMCAAALRLRNAGVRFARLYALVEVLDYGKRGGPPAWYIAQRHLSS